MSEPAFGEIIRLGREKARISQARLAELIGRSPSTVRAWEHGRSRPSDRSYVKAMAAVLGLEETELMEAAGFDPPDGARFRPTIEQELLSLASEQTALLPLPGPMPEPAPPTPLVVVPAVEPPPLAEAATQPELKSDPEETPPAHSNGSSKSTRKVTTLLPAAPVLVSPPSYIEDREEKEFYWRRWAMTAATVLFLAVVFAWSLRQAGGALGDFIGDFLGSFDL